MKNELHKTFSGKAEAWAVDITTGETWRSMKPEILKNNIIVDRKKEYIESKTYGGSYDIKFIYYIKPRTIDGTQQTITLI